MQDIKINIKNLKEIEEYKSILALYEEGKLYLKQYKWCKNIINCWYDYDFGIYEKLGVFLFEIEPLDDTVDYFIWLIIGDIPTVYIDQSIKSGKEAIERYCELMNEWADKVIEGRSLENCYPVEAEPSVENAELLKRKIKFIKRELLI